jgi:hypothetical protein
VEAPLLLARARQAPPLAVLERAWMVEYLT